MESRATIVVVGVIYAVAVAAIGAWAARRTRTAHDFFMAGSGIGLIALTLSTMSASLSGFAFIGGPGLVYSVGLGALFIILPASITNALSAWVLGKRLRLLAEARDVLTLPDAIGIRFGSPAAQGLAAVAILVAVVGYLAAQILAMGFAFDAIFEVGLDVGIWSGTALVLAYSAAGGIVAGIYTDVLQGAWMALVSVLVFAVVLDVGGGIGGMSTSILAVDPAFLAPWGHLTPLAAVGFYFVFSVGVLGQPHVIHKFYMIRDPEQLKWYPVLATGALILMILLFFGVGLAVKALVARGELAPLASPDAATPTFLLGFTPTLLAALVFSGVAAAIMSSVNSFLNIGAAALTHDIPRALGRPVDDELRVGRWTTVVICLVAALTASTSNALVIFLGIFGWGLFASTLVPALAIGLNWEGGTRAGAIASIATGLGLTVVFEVAAFFGAWSFPAGVSVSAVTLVMSILVFLLVSILTTSGAGSDIDADIRVVMEV